MKVGFIMPFEYVKKISSFKDKFDYIEFTEFVYYNNVEIKYIVEREQRKFDALLFAGPSPYMYAKQNTEQEILWDYIPRHQSSVMRGLLEASTKNYNIRNASFDTFSRIKIEAIYEEIGINLKDVEIYTVDDTNIYRKDINEHILDSDYCEKIFHFHKDLYESGKVSYCATNLYKVHKRLMEVSIPNILIIPTYAVIRECASKLYLKYTAQLNTNSQIAVLSMDIILPDKYSAASRNEYQYILDKMKISEQIYLFAQKIQATVVETSFNNYLLFATKNILEMETENFSNIVIFKSVQKNALCSLSIGIGYGQTTVDAKYNANAAMEKAKKHGGNTAYVIYVNGDITGPIEGSKHDEIYNKLNGKLYMIAEKSQISVNKIYKIYSIMNKNKQNYFTPIELAKEYCISIRSMNRIISKLEEAGYVEVIGQKLTSETGRPSRIIRINFD